jgi:hypothetical protein
VSEPLADDLGVHAGLQGEGGVGVARNPLWVIDVTNDAIRLRR